MKSLIFRLLAFVLFFEISFASIAQISISDLDGRVNTITSAVPFLTITPDSRAGGMGDIGVATSADINSMYWNPAKYSFAKDDFGVGISYTPWLQALVPDISLTYLSGYKKFNGNRVLAASLRYFSLGNITFTDFSGEKLRDFNPNEFSLDVAYSMLFSDNFSGSVALRYIYSNLTGGIYSNNSPTHAGQSVAGDIALFYTKDIKIAKKSANMAFGMNISNIGRKISYTDDSEANFIPTNLRLGGALTYNIDEYNQLMFGLDLNKLLIPTPPVYDGNGTSPDNIIAGMDPNVSVPVGIWHSFYDAPGGSKEEFREIMISTGFEYWYNQMFALRTGYFHEHETKGNRKYFTVGLGLKLNVFQLDFAYLITTQQRNPLENTLRFSLTFNMNKSKSKTTE